MKSFYVSDCINLKSLWSLFTEYIIPKMNKRARYIEGIKKTQFVKLSVTT